MNLQHKNALGILMLCTIVAAALVSLANAETTTSLTATSTDNANTIELTGAGFDASENVTIKMLNATSDATLYTFPETVTTDSDGAFTATLALPPGYYGTYNFTAQISTHSANDQYLIDDAATLTSAPDDSNIINVVGTGFNAQENITLTLNDTSTSTAYTFLDTITTHADGTFNTTVIIPTSLSGNYTLIAASSTATANTDITTPDLIGPQGETGSIGATGATGVAGEAGTPGTPADTTILYFALVLSIAAVAVALVSLVKKH